MPASVALFKKYPNRILVETGSYAGDGIQCALDAGFIHVISIELSERHYLACKCRFEEDSRAWIVRGDSSQVLSGVLARIDEPVTLWLDGHWSGGLTAYGPEKETPLMDELDAIAAHHIKGHTILIDDMQDWRRDKPGVGFGKQEIMRKIRDISEHYRFTIEDGPSGPGGILAASFR